VVATALGLFVSGMVQQFGAEAANRLMEGLSRLRRSGRTNGDHDIRLVDEANNLVIVVSSKAIADERAMAALVAQERHVFVPDVELHWDPDDGRWRARRPG
jgi:hypothetical protein